jgi:rubrerythrin
MLLEMAKQREEHAISFYEKNYSQVSSNMIQKVFEGLTKVEQEHVELTNID